MLKDARKGSKKVTFLIAANTSKVTFGVLSGTPPEPIILRFGVLPWGHWMMKSTKKVELSILGLLGGPPWFRVEWALKAKKHKKKRFQPLFSGFAVYSRNLMFYNTFGTFWLETVIKTHQNWGPKELLKRWKRCVLLCFWRSGRLLGGFWTASGRHRLLSSGWAASGQLLDGFWTASGRLLGCFECSEYTR